MQSTDRQKEDFLKVAERFKFEIEADHIYIDVITGLHTNTCSSGENQQIPFPEWEQRMQPPLHLPHIHFLGEINSIEKQVT